METRTYYAVSIGESEQFLDDWLLYQRRDQFLEMIKDPRTMTLPGVAERFNLTPEQVKQLSEAKPSEVPVNVEIVEPVQPVSDSWDENGFRAFWSSVNALGLTQDGFKQYLAECGVDNWRNLGQAQRAALLDMCTASPDYVSQLNAAQAELVGDEF